MLRKSTSIKLVNKKNEDRPGGGGPILVSVPSLSTVGEVALRSVAKASMSQDCSGRKGTEQPLLWDGNPFNPELGLGAQVPLTHPLPLPAAPKPHPGLPLKTCQVLALSFAALLESTSQQWGQR